MKGKKHTPKDMEETEGRKNGDVLKFIKTGEVFVPSTADVCFLHL